MRAVELRIVLEDDDGRTYTQTFTPPNAAVLNVVAAAMQMGSEEPPIVGPVLRKVTEVEGRLVDREFQGDEPCVAFPREPSGIMRSVGINENLFPDGVAAKYDEEKDDYAGPSYRFRFDVTAVRVPDPERDARELCGLPEKKGDPR